jgi:hypothetical protein
MARYLSPEEIDTMLNQINKNLEASAAEPIIQNNTVQETRLVNKIFRRQSRIIPQNTFKYTSPVIKREYVRYNPNSVIASDFQGIIVHSMEQYHSKLN